ncbi:MAG: EAL domain-containing protein [Gallionella sp.]
MTGNSGMRRTIQAIFYPAIALMRRLGYTRKFALLWLMSLIAVAVVVYNLHVSLDREIRTSQRELEGIALAAPISRTVQFLQQHRGLSTAVLGGNKSMRDWRAAKEKEATDVFDATERILPPNLTSSEDWRSIKANWERLRKEGLNWAAAENFAVHTRLIDQLLIFKIVVSGEYVLPLDPQIDTSYLIDVAINRLPMALEHLGQTRAYGTDILSRKQITDSQKVAMKTLIAEFNNEAKFLKIALEKAIRYNPALQDVLASPGRLNGLARHIADLVESDILPGHFATSPGDFYMEASAAIDNGYAQMYESLLPTIEALIKARIARAEDALRISIGVAFLLFLLAAYFSVGIYYVIIGSIRSLARSARAFAGGDMRERINLDTRDELSQVGDSFNEMADGFSALLAAHKQAEESLVRESYRNKMLLRTASDGIHILDLEGNVVQVNDAFCRMLGYTASEMLSMNAAQWDAQWTAAQIKANIDALGENASMLETRHRRRDGSIIDVEISVVKVDIGGQQLVYCSSRDVTERKQAEQALMKSRQRAQHYLDTAGVMLISLDAQGRVQMINRKGCEMLGHSEADILGKNWFENYLHEPARKGVKKVFTQIMDGNIAPVEYFENDILTAGGDVLTVAWHNSPLLDESGKIDGVLSSGEDITGRKRAERALMESSERLHAVIETALDAVVQMDDGGVITGWNAQAEKIFGWPREEAIGRMMSETIIPPQYREAHVQGMKRFLSTGAGSILNSRVELLGLRRDGREFPVELAVVPIKASGKTADKYEFSAFIRDITQKKESEDLIWKQANFDALTGLPNRHMFFDRLAQETRKADRTGLTMALLYIDLDRFKEINDTLGHSMGDKLLVETARRIGACVRETDTVARPGGDEFIIILTELNEASRIDALTQNILHELAEPFQLGSEVVYLSASIGITLYPHDAAGMEELVKNADQAMYAAKNTGRNRFSYFTQSMQQAAQAKLRLANDLRGALASSQFRVYYQPIVELATGRIHKAEALIRWQHPVRGLVSPAEFIPLTEETGLILGIGDWVFRETARQAKRWRALYDPEFQISVNMSPIQFHSADSPCQAWTAYLQELELPGQSLVIEITEGLLLNENTGVKDKLLRFHDTGIQISLDDFGTGYSSLSYLQKFDVDYLKIDQSFTRNLEHGSSNLALSDAIIMMAHRLGMKVIAEGIETETQRTLLDAAGCNYGQGYLFSRPVPAGEFEELLKIALTGGFLGKH